MEHVKMSDGLRSLTFSVCCDHAMGQVPDMLPTHIFDISFHHGMGQVQLPDGLRVVCLGGGCWAAIRVAAGHAVGHVAVLFADSALRRGSTFAATLCAKRGLSALSRTAICTIVPLYCHGCMCCLRLHSVNDLHAHRNAYVRARWAAYTHIGGHIYIYVCVVCYIFRIHELVNTLMHCIDFNMGLAEVISSTRSHPNSVVPMQHIYLLLVVLFALVVLAVRFLEGRKFMGSGLLIVAVGDHQCIVR